MQRHTLLELKIAYAGATAAVDQLGVYSAFEKRVQPTTARNASQLREKL